MVVGPLHLMLIDGGMRSGGDGPQLRTFEFAGHCTIIIISWIFSMQKKHQIWQAQYRIQGPGPFPCLQSSPCSLAVDMLGAEMNLEKLDHNII